jgi:hypothetical protein
MDEEDLEAGGFGTSDWLKVIGGVLFFVAGLLPWWSYSFSDVGLKFSDNALDFTLTGIVPYAIFALIALVTIIVKTGSSHLPVFLSHPLTMLVAAVIATGLVVYRFVDDPGENASRSIGIYLAIASALLVLAGCVIDVREMQLDAERAEEYFDAAPDSESPHPPLP